MCREDAPNSPPQDISPEDELTWSRHMVVPGDSLWETSSAAVALAKSGSLLQPIHRLLSI